MLLVFVSYMQVVLWDMSIAMGVLDKRRKRQTTTTSSSSNSRTSNASAKSTSAAAAAGAGASATANGADLGASFDEDATATGVTAAGVTDKGGHASSAAVVPLAVSHIDLGHR